MMTEQIDDVQGVRVSSDRGGGSDEAGVAACQRARARVASVDTSGRGGRRRPVKLLNEREATVVVARGGARRGAERPGRGRRAVRAPKAWEKVAVKCESRGKPVSMAMRLTAASDVCRAVAADRRERCAQRGGGRTHAGGDDVLAWGLGGGAMCGCGAGGARLRGRRGTRRRGPWGARPWGRRSAGLLGEDDGFEGERRGGDRCAAKRGGAAEREGGDESRRTRSMAERRGRRTGS